MKTTMKKITAVILLIVMCLSLLTACGSKKIKMTDYITVTFSGENRDGRARIKFDSRAFEDDVTANWKKKDMSLEKMGALLALEMSIECEANKDEDLRNGDKVKVTITYDKDAARELGLSITGLTGTYKVKGLD